MFELVKVSKVSAECLHFVFISSLNEKNDFKYE